MLVLTPDSVIQTPEQVEVEKLPGTFTLDYWGNLSKDEVRKRGRELVRAVNHKDQLICMLVRFGCVDAMPKHFADEVRRIVEAYSDDETPAPGRDQR